MPGRSPRSGYLLGAGIDRSYSHPSTRPMPYSDPAIPAGVRRNDAIHAYFTKLLGRNPEWGWTHTGSIPMQDGFLNRWHASIPVAQRTVEAHGVCTVQLRGGLIYANHVYFDRSELLTTLSEA